MIHFTLPGLPPSANHAYFTRGKVRALSTEGKKYKNETMAHLQKEYRQAMMFFKKNTRYQVYFRFHVEGLQNKNWSGPKSKVNRYKKFDGGNLCKLLEDCIAAAGGIDDSQTMRSIWEKLEGSPEKTEVWVWNLDDETDPFDFDFFLKYSR